ncbi:MAG: hypothetical protein IJC21_00025 [Lentisphaeria bacterium]|nr:hypothetical protein [Lentisphaeria bacterium]
MTCNVGDTICNCTLLQKCGEGAYGEVWLAREVANGANYILAIFAKLDEHGNEIAWEGEIVPLLDAVLRHQKGLPVFEKIVRE